MDISNVTTSPAIETLVTQFMMLEQRPIIKIQKSKAETNTKIAMFNDLKSKLDALRDLAKDFNQIGSLSKFGDKSVASANENYITATANGDASSGSHLLKVSQLAKADTVVTNTLTQTGTTILTTEGTGTKTFSITIDGTVTNINVDITAGEDDKTILEKIAEAITGSDAGAKASIVNDSPTTSKLVLRSDSTGSTNSISLTDVTGTLLSTIGLDDSTQASGTGGGYIYQDTELNALFELDGISITHDSNSVDDVLTGVTIELKGTHETTDDPTQITIEPDKDKIKENLETFFEKYNEVISYLKEKMAVDPDSGIRGQLSGDFTFINLRLNLRTIVSSEVTGIQSGNPSLISEIGIEPDDDGKLSIIDTDAFEEALAANVNKVADLFNSSNGITAQLYDLITPFTTTGGIIDNDNSTLDERVEHFDTRIGNLEKRLEWKEQSYRRQFIKLQQAYDALSIQQSIASVINSSVNSMWQ